MTYLLDTHAFYWLVREPHRVTPTVRNAIATAGVVRVSDVSAFEVATKVRLGKFDPARALVDAWSNGVRSIGATLLPVTTEHGLRAGGLESDHRDPFDRLIAAQAQVEQLRLVTSDPAFSDLVDRGTFPC